MADTTATIEQDFITTATVNTVSSSGTTASNLDDVDTTTNGLQTGSLLIYNSSTSKWVSQIELNSQDITGGQY